MRFNAGRNIAWRFNRWRDNEFEQVGRGKEV